jgi:hypothetical protein
MTDVLNKEAHAGLCVSRMRLDTHLMEGKKSRKLYKFYVLYTFSASLKVFEKIKQKIENSPDFIHYS